MSGRRPGEPPLIGVTVGRQPARFGVWDLTADVVDARYADSVARHGGVPVLLSAGSGAGSATRLVSVLDGVVLSGGPDVDPDRYGASPHSRTDAPQPRRDDFELAVLEAALSRDLPVLAVCRGAQLLNVARGGTLCQHLDAEAGGDEHLVAPGVFGATRIALAPGSRVHDSLGDELQGRCHHHQAIATLGSALEITATSAHGTVEAIEGPRDGGFLVGVQWHPEADEGSSRLFGSFVEAARTAAGAIRVGSPA